MNTTEQKLELTQKDLSLVLNILLQKQSEGEYLTSDQSLACRNAVGTLYMHGYIGAIDYVDMITIFD